MPCPYDKFKRREFSCENSRLKSTYFIRTGDTFSFTIYIQNVISSGEKITTNTNAIESSNASKNNTCFFRVEFFNAIINFIRKNPIQDKPNNKPSVSFTLIQVGPPSPGNGK